MREKFGPKGATIIVGVIAIVFVFFGVYTPGDHSGGPGVAGMVNGEPISQAEVGREMQRRMEFFKNLKISPEQLKMLRLEDSVFNDLASRVLLMQEAERRGMVPSKDEIKAKIEEYPVFKKDGKFNRQAYEQALGGAQLSPAQFEKMIRSELMGERWQQLFKSFVAVSEVDLNREWEVGKDRRSVRYVLITPELAQKAVQVKDEEVSKLLKDPQQKNLVERRFEAGKAYLYKGKKLQDVETSIARELIASQKVPEIKAESQRLASAVAKVLTSDKKSDKAVRSLLKVVGGDVRDSGPMTRRNPFIPGIGEAKDLMRDAFDVKLQQPKIYHLTAGTVVAVEGLVERPTSGKAEDKKAELKKIRSELESARERELFGAFIKHLTEKANIVRSKTEES